jgi:putative membrane protein insertion efficiency factor
MPNPPKNLLSRAFTRTLVFGVLLYRVYLGPYLGGHCRYHPSCSQYALDALEKHGPLLASWKTLRRLARCHPFAKGGFDPA